MTNLLSTSIDLFILAQRYVGYMTLPIAVVVGTIGYKLEQHFIKPKEIPYLDHSIVEERLKREMDSNIDLKEFHMMEEKTRIVPKSSLLLNTSRNFDKKQ